MSKVKEAKGKKSEKRARGNGELTGNELKVLTALKGTSAGGKTLSRSKLKEKTGINKGYSKMLGAATKGDMGDGLESRGFVKHVKIEDQRELGYHITAKGTALVSKPPKAKREKEVAST